MSAIQQTGAVFRREIRRSFFARRGLWVYLLAFAPFLVFFAYTTMVRVQSGERRAFEARQQKPLTESDFDSLLIGSKETADLAALGRPAREARFFRRHRDEKGQIEFRQEHLVRYSDGSTIYTLVFENDTLQSLDRDIAPTTGDVSFLFSSVFQFFFLRLAVFFGCLGIFMNLFRGELLDKSLHFYFLAPVRREVVMAGKFLAGLVASCVIFGVSAMGQIWMLDHAGASGSVAAVAHAPAYIGIIVLACLGYGALFLACGLMFRNPVLPAVVLLLWESVVPFLPALLKKFSVFYYLTQMCPVSVASGPNTPPLFAILVSAPDPISKPAAVVGLIVLAAVVLGYSARRVRRLEIDYSSE